MLGGEAFVCEKKIHKIYPQLIRLNVFQYFIFESLTDVEWRGGGVKYLAFCVCAPACGRLAFVILNAGKVLTKQEHGERMEVEGRDQVCDVTGAAIRHRG